MPITILDVLKARRAAAGLLEKEYGYDEADFADQNLLMLGGCGGCRATLAAYNAYPDKSGVWRCSDCLANGYETVQAFELDDSKQDRSRSE